MTDRLQWFLNTRRAVIFPKEQRTFLTPLVECCHHLEHTLRIPPRAIAEIAMLMADFRKHNVKEGYLTEKEISRRVQKIQHELYGDI